MRWNEMSDINDPSVVTSHVRCINLSANTEQKVHLREFIIRLAHKCKSLMKRSSRLSSVCLSACPASDLENDCMIAYFVSLIWSPNRHLVTSSHVGMVAVAMSEFSIQNTPNPSKTKRDRRKISSPYRKSGSPSKNMTSDFALEVAKYNFGSGIEPIVSLR